MKTFIRYGTELLIEYNEADDSYGITDDDLYGFPYEAFDFFEMNGESYCELVLDDIESYPTTRNDIWLEEQEMIRYLQGYVSETEIGKKRNQALLDLIHAYVDRSFV